MKGRSCLEGSIPSKVVGCVDNDWYREAVEMSIGFSNGLDKTSFVLGAQVRPSSSVALWMPEISEGCGFEATEYSLIIAQMDARDSVQLESNLFDAHSSESHIP